jgi:hypothetical protein
VYSPAAPECCPHLQRDIQWKQPLEYGSEEERYRRNKPRRLLGLPDVEDATLAIQLKNGVFWDDTPCGSCKNRRFGGT